MITISLTLALLFSIGLIVHFLKTGQFWEAVKAVGTAGGIFVLLMACLTFRRNAREVGY